jgi:hypothetical protein
MPATVCSGLRIASLVALIACMAVLSISLTF